MKFLRDYIITIITPENETVTIKPPFSVEFKITRNTLASANRCSLTIINMSPNIRRKIFKDRYSIAEYWQVQIKAGYKRLYTVFQGNILESISFKRGTEWFTTLDCFDGLSGIQNGFTNQTVSAGTDQKDVLSGIIKDMPNVISGFFGLPSEGTNDRGKVLFGQSSEVLAEQTEGQYFIDNEIVNIIDSEEVIADQVVILDSNQLFTTPKKRETFLDCEVLFMPDANIGKYCEVRSLEAIYNGQYKIMGFTHNVLISQATCGIAKTMISLYAGAAGLREL